MPDIRDGAERAAAPPLSETAAEEHIHGICFKTGPPARVGVELERQRAEIGKNAIERFVKASCIRHIDGEGLGMTDLRSEFAEPLLQAAPTAALIASGPAKHPVQGFTETAGAELV